MKTSSALFNLPTSLLLLLRTALAQRLPYNPTRIFLPQQDGRIAYVLQPIGTTGSQFDLSSIDISNGITPSSLDISTQTSSLPFLSSSTNAAVNAVLDDGDNITIYIGACGSAGEIWKLNTLSKEKGLGGWVQQTQRQSSVPGAAPQYLSSTVSFSSNVSGTASDIDYYYFGGMCPYEDAAQSTWQSSANYSRNMVSITSLAVEGQFTYQSAFTTTRNSPIAQAGQSLTALQPTFSNHSDGSQTQQQDFVLLGGHTQTAFMNMSQVALWSLPQEAWTYFSIAQGDTGTRTDLTVRNEQVQIEPRSGHTAVLSSDGAKIVVFGGWVGDTNTPAQPQLAVLNVADSYGGSGDWSWSTPEITQNEILSNGTGLYGHGAIMLPGNIMFVLGGYTIPAASSKIRRADLTSNTQAYLFNVSSNAWLTSYSMPAISTGEQTATSGPLAKTSQKAGLAIGLGLGGVAIATLLCVYLWYKHRNQQLREEREKEIQSSAFAVRRYETDEWGIPPAGGPYPSVSAMEMGGDREKAVEQVYQSWRSTTNQAERTGLLVEVPSPTRGLRRNITGGRGPYPYGRRHSQNMEVIEERKDQEDSRSMEESDLQKRTAQFLAARSDPFTDNANPLRNHPISANNSPEVGRTAVERQQEVQGWVENWGKAAEALMSPSETTQQQGTEGRNSPTKSDRTTSMLSDSSEQSSWSSRSGTGPSGIVRTLSTRSTALLNSFATTFVGGSASLNGATDARATLPSQQRRRGSSFTTTGTSSSPTRSRPDTGVSTIRQDGDSYSIAQTSFQQLQAEGEALLGGNRSNGKSEPSSPVKEKKNMGWYGSVKRVISGARTTSMAASTSRGVDRSGSSSPQKPDSRDGELPPRRAASDASFLRSRRGAQDWNMEDDGEDSVLQRPSAPDGELEGDWDVERAVENRVVQLMFTVPRQRLRVVNADEADARSLLSQDEGHSLPELE